MPWCHTLKALQDYRFPELFAKELVLRSGLTFLSKARVSVQCEAVAVLDLKNCASWPHLASVEAPYKALKGLIRPLRAL